MEEAVAVEEAIKVVVVETMVVVMAVDTVMQRTIPLTHPTIGDSIIPQPLSL